MRRTISWLLLITLLCAAAYEAYTHLEQARLLAHLVKLKAAPCSTPLTYSIGSVDERFGISTETLSGGLKEAVALWNEPARLQLFEFAGSSGDVTVNLVYDNRQAAADTLKAAGIITDQSRSSYDALKTQYDQLAARVDSEQAAQDSRLAFYKNNAADYNAVVRQWNRSGSAPAEVDRRIRAEKAALAREFAAVKSFERELNADIDTLNAIATTLNQLIVELNLNAEQYNRTGASMGVFEQGVYKSTAGVQTIDIYEYSSHAQLVRVLAHELGHALGMEHVAAPGAIMYRINSGESLAITGADIAELNRVCRQEK